MPTLTKPDITLQRRKAVSQLRLRGQSLDSIYLALAHGGKEGAGRIINPDTGRPFTRQCIADDLKKLRKQATIDVQQNVDEHKSRQFAEIQEIKRAAWSSKSPSLALQAINLEMKLLGTNEPIKINIQMEVITQLVDAIEANGKDASTVFNDMLRLLNEQNAQ